MDEAIELLSQYDMHFSLGRAQHYSLSDTSGRSVAVEWKNGEMVVTDTTVVTNFYLHGDDGSSGSGQSYVRYNTLKLGGVNHFHYYLCRQTKAAEWRILWKNKIWK